MEPLVSVIVPTRNSEKTIGPCLESIAEQSYSNIEIIVVDNHSEDYTQGVAARFTDKVFEHGPERSAQRNFGAQVSNGEYLLFPDSDMELTRDVIKECVQKVAADPKVEAIVIPEESFGLGFWANCRRLERSFYIGVEWLEAARFFKKSVFEEMGGYDLRNTGTEDFDLPQRIKAAHGPESNSRITSLVYHNEQEMGLFEAIKTNYYYGHNLDAYLSVRANRKYFRKQYNLVRRYALFFSDPKKLFENPILGLGTLFMKACDAGAWATGFLVGRLKDRVAPRRA
jgi:glycosyltransferase involved in cell wall biosynthesis